MGHRSFQCRRSAGELLEKEGEPSLGGSPMIAGGKNSSYCEPIGAPRALLFHESPLYLHFMKELGINIILSDKMNASILAQGLLSSRLDVCFPVKAALGHIKNLIEKGVKTFFIPAIIEEPKQKAALFQAISGWFSAGSACGSTYSCPYIQAFPDFVRTIAPTGAKILTPLIPRNACVNDIRKALCDTARKLGFPARGVGEKISRSLQYARDFRRRLNELGKEFIERSRTKRLPGVVLFARHYAIDASCGLDMPGMFERLGVAALPYDLIAFDDAPIPGGFEKNTWSFGIEYLRAASAVLSQERLFPVIISSYGCGPDSFFAGYLRKIFQERPHIELDIDEHQSEEGLRTRIEAFVEIIKDYGSPSNFQYRLPERDLHRRTFKGKTIYVPRPCDHYLAIAEALRKGGIEAEALPPPDGESEYLARSHVSGKECYPFILFAGDMLRLTGRGDFQKERSAFLVLGGGTSCRGSEFGRCMRRILADIGIEIPVLDFHVSFKENEFYDSLGQGIAREMWRGWVAIDYLLKLLYEVRPFEKSAGETEEAYRGALAGVLKDLGTSDFINAVARGAESVSKIAPLMERKARLKEKFIVGLIGEHFMTINPYANNNMAKALEASGGVIFLPSHFNDYVLFSSDTRWRNELPKAPLKAPLLYLQAFMQNLDEKEIGAVFAPHLLNHPEPSPRDAIERASRYISSSIDPIAVLHVVKAQDFAMKGVDGLLNVMPLGCLLNYIPTLGAYEGISRDFGIPRCDLRMDGLMHTGERTRLEAFIDLMKERKTHRACAD